MRRLAALLLTLAQIACRPARPTPLPSAAAYLWSKQANDGGWHSSTYGLLRSGQSLTPFVLDALLQVEPGNAARVDAAIAFIKRNTRSDGAAGMMDATVPDYPNYATALAVSALRRAARPGWQRDIRPMIQYLRGQQFTEQNGWHPSDPAYGAWGMGGERRTPPGTGHVDLSMTRYALEALRAGGVSVSDPTFQKAAVFLARCQNADGGFFFSTSELDTNKAGQDGDQIRSYGSTTADGILALLALGRPPIDKHLSSAQQWLVSHHRNMRVPGFIGPAYQRWPGGLSFYYASASTAALHALHLGTGPVVEDLKRAQRPDGSWSNPENLVKEDDPLIATPLAVRALAAFRQTARVPT